MLCCQSSSCTKLTPLLFHWFVFGAQFVSLAIGLEINWPPALVDLFHLQKGASSVTEAFVSFDCALTEHSGTCGEVDNLLFYKTQVRD